MSFAARPAIRSWARSWTDGHGIMEFSYYEFGLYVLYMLTNTYLYELRICNIICIYIFLGRGRSRFQESKDLVKISLEIFHMRL